MSLRKQVLFFLSLPLITGVLIFVTGEILVRVFDPVRYMYPRYKFSPKYGFELYENARMVHGHPGKFKFFYSVNEYGYRGHPVPPSGSYTKSNIVVLGDSFSFGQGVNDGEEYPALLREALAAAYEVINLATPGWGLTQQIRRYYDFGRLYEPDVVILQYSLNDPEDNLNQMVTVLGEDGFEFVDSHNPTNWVKKYLSGSIIQRSQLYNFFRGRVYEHFQDRFVNEQASEQRTAVPPAEEGVMPREVLYCQLLERFVEDLNASGVIVIMIAVEKSLDVFTHIRDCVSSLNADDAIHYVELMDLFGPTRNEGFYSAEGHWGPRAHRLIGEGLVQVIRHGSVGSQDKAVR
jgi:hypothetical protein